MGKGKDKGKPGPFIQLAGTALLVAAGPLGCLSDDTSLSLAPRDAASVDTGLVLQALDASGAVGTSPSSDDAGIDAAAVDATFPPSDSGPPDAASYLALPSQLGLVAGGSLTRSSHYAMTGTEGPATAPPLTSPHYRLVGGMSATAQKP
jgi:hypothetical protein